MNREDSDLSFGAFFIIEKPPEAVDVDGDNDDARRSPSPEIAEKREISLSKTEKQKNKRKNHKKNQKKPYKGLPNEVVLPFIGSACQPISGSEICIKIC